MRLFCLMFIRLLSNLLCHSVLQGGSMRYDRSGEVEPNHHGKNPHSKLHDGSKGSRHSNGLTITGLLLNKALKAANPTK